MQRMTLALLLVILLGLTWVNTASAQHGEPLYTCPRNFELHHVMDHDQQHHDGAHQHIGTDVDQNGDGYICVRHVGADGSKHLHIDNRPPKQ